MSEAVKYISKVEIKGLWGRYDLAWDLNEDVNVLSGANGSGKSTILSCVYGLISYLLLQDSSIPDEIGNHISDIKISFDNDCYVIYNFFRKDVTNIPTLAFCKNISNDFKRLEFYGSTFHGIVTENLSSNEINNFPEIYTISTFDTELKPVEAVQKLSGTLVKTELDWELSQLQTKYLSYQIDIGKRAFEAISNNETNGKLLKIRATYERFLSLVDDLFHETGKRINRQENEISFLLGEEKITAYDLSSGEKQLLIILLTVLVQDNKRAILFMDEPELSLHFDWQEKLIQYIRELNPNVQIILATHSPAIITDGWMDKVSNVSDLITLDRKSEIHAVK